MYKKVFISYASEDFEKALEVFHFLTDRSYDPWLDKKKLNIGDNWDLRIKGALRESDFVIFLLSSKSIEKRGYVQKEFRLALEYSTEKLIDDIYILPIILDDIKPPDQLSHLQWINISDKHVFERLLQSLEVQRKIYLSSLSKSQIELGESYVGEFLKLPNYFNNSLSYYIKRPTFLNNPYWEIDFVNKIVFSQYTERINNLSNHYFINQNYFRRKSPSTYTLDFEIIGISEHYLSIQFEEEVIIGLELPQRKVFSLNFLFNPNYLIIPKIHFSYSELISVITNAKFNKYIDKNDNEDFAFIQEVITENLPNVEFTMNGKKIELDFSNYLPKVIHAACYFEVPYKIVDHKICLLTE